MFKSKKKKPEINYGFSTLKYALLFVFLILATTVVTYLFYREKAGALFIAEQLYADKKLNISSYKEVLSKDMNKNLAVGLKSKVLLYNDDIQTFDNFIGSVEVYQSEPLARIRRSTLKYSNKYINSLTDDYIYLMNNTYKVYLYKNVILRLSSYVTEEQEETFYNSLKEILSDVTLNNEFVMTPREINEKTEEVNAKIKAFIDSEFDINDKERIEY